MERSQILEIMQQILKRQGKSSEITEDALLHEIGFRSLDFSELALRVEMTGGEQLDFSAGELRAIRTVGDTLDFMTTAYRGKNC